MAGERRAHPRLRTRQTTIRNALLVGRVVDLSVGGLGLETTTGVRIGSRHSFTVAVGERPFRVEGEVRWCRLTQTIGRGEGEVAPIYRAGIRFTLTPDPFPAAEPKSSGGWIDPAVRVSR